MPTNFMGAKPRVALGSYGYWHLIFIKRAIRATITLPRSDGANLTQARDTFYGYQATYIQQMNQGDY